MTKLLPLRNVDRGPMSPERIELRQAALDFWHPWSGLPQSLGCSGLVGGGYIAQCTLCSLSSSLERKKLDQPLLRFQMLTVQVALGRAFSLGCSPLLTKCDNQVVVGATEGIGSNLKPCRDA